MNNPLHAPSKRIQQRTMRAFAWLGLIGMIVFGFPSPVAHAGVITLPRDFMNRQKPDLGASDLVQHEIFFKTSSSGGLVGGKLKITFPNDTNNNTKWCRTAGTDLTVTGITDPTGLASTENATILPGTLAGSCAQGTPDQIVVTFTGTTANSTEYGVRISNGSTGKLGTGAIAANNIKVTVQETTSADAVTDTGYMALSLVSATGGDQYTVSATIDPTLTVALSNTTVSLNGVNSLDATHINYQGITSTVTTNAKSGYVSMVKYSGVMSNGTDNYTDAGGTLTAGIAGFGAATSMGSQTIAADNTSPTCAVSQQQQTADANASGLTTTFQKFASSIGAKNAEATTLCFLMAIGVTTPPGTYTTTVTLVTTAKF